MACSGCELVFPPFHCATGVYAAMRGGVGWVRLGWLFHLFLLKWLALAVHVFFLHSPPTPFHSIPAVLLRLFTVAASTSSFSSSSSSPPPPLLHYSNPTLCPLTITPVRNTPLAVSLTPAYTAFDRDAVIEKQTLLYPLLEKYRMLPLVVLKG